MTEGTIEKLFDSLRPQILALAEQFDATDDEAEQRAIAEEATNVVCGAIIRDMLETKVMPQMLAIAGVEQFARAAAGGIVTAQARVPPIGGGGEFVVPKA